MTTWKLFHFSPRATARIVTSRMNRTDVGEEEEESIFQLIAAPCVGVSSGVEEEPAALIPLEMMG